MCRKLHDPALKADYEKSTMDFGYEFEQYEQLQQFIGDCDRKVCVVKWKVLLLYLKF